ncbi:MAG: hypothetical protein RL180_1378 [Pseudomonadota bacterium]|jgi:hypothetical protein
MELTDEMVTRIGMGVGVPIVLMFLFFIIWDLAKASKAGRFGTLMMFLVLGGGFISYIIKEVIMWWMQRSL